MKHNNSEVEVVVDALMSAIRTIVQTTGRLPAVSGIQSLLETAVNEVADQITGINNQEVVGVTIRKKEPGKKAVKVGAGTVFVCCVDGDYFHGRVLDRLQLGTLVEFYDLPVKRRLTLNEIYARESLPVIHRYLFDASLFNKPGVRVIGVRPVPKNYEYPLFFLLGGALHHPRNKRQGRLQKEQVLKLEPVHTYPGNAVLDNLSRFGFRKVWPETAQLRTEVLKLLAKRDQE